MAAALLASCSAHKTTVLTGNGTATVTTSNDNKTTTVDTKEGHMTVGKDAVDTSKLGAPVYPGAQAEDSGGIAMSSAKGSGQMVAFKTTDSFEKVYAFYKAQMPKDSEKMKFAQGDSSMATFQVGDDKGPETTSVMITAKSGETDILITHGTQSPNASATEGSSD
jgi:hypothetical protein